jgi:arylsulfatase A-like enzyme
MKTFLNIYVSIAILILVTSCNSKDSTNRQEHKKPNIIFILIDDMSIADLGCYGNDYHETPNIDMLANEGVKFTNAYASAPVCSPTRASILTGKYPASVHITDWITGKPSWQSEALLAPDFLHQLPLEETTIAEMLKENGYTTASFGKWHLGDEGSFPQDHGFDTNVAGNEAGLPPSYFYPYIDGDFVLPDLHTGGEEGEFLTDRLTREAMNWAIAKKDSSFFLYLPYFTVHIWLETKTELKEKYIEKAQADSFKSLTNPVYAGMVETLDHNIGNIINTLEENDLDENTLIIFYSDNGGLHKDESENTPATDNGIFREGKGHLYEGGIRVPLMFYWKNTLKPTISDEVVTSTDFMPTLAEFTGTKSPENEGVSLYQHLTEGSPLDERNIYWHYPHYSYQLGQPSGAIRAGNYKLIEFFEDGSTELYDLENDPGESKNLADSLPEIDLLEQLHQWQTEAGAEMPTANPDYDPESK